MKSIVENLSPTRVKLAVEVPFDDLKDKFDEAYKRIGAQVRVPGFRPGKVPPRILEARIGRGTVIQEVINEALPEAYGEALSDNDITPLGQPEIEVTGVEDDNFKFTAEVDTRPEITIPDLTTLTAEIEDVEVEDAEIDEQIEALRARFGSLKGVDRAVQDGDFVSLDLQAKVNGEEVEGGSATGLSYEVGTGQLVPGIDEQLIGMNADDEKTFTSTLVAGDHAGEDADITVTVKSVKEQELPEIDDEFASLASEFDTLDELRDDLRGRLEQAKSFARINSARDAAIEAILEQVEFDLPEKARESELEARRHDAVHAFDHDEDQLNAWIEEQGKTREEFDKETEQNAEKSMRAQLVLDQIADDEQIGVDDQELTQYIISQASRYGMAPQQFADEIQKAGQIGALVSDVRRNKAVEHVLSKVAVKDASGNDLDLDAIREEAIAALGQTMNVGESDESDESGLDELADAELDAADEVEEAEASDEAGSSAEAETEK